MTIKTITTVNQNSTRVKVPKYRMPVCNASGYRMKTRRYSSRVSRGFDEMKITCLLQALYKSFSAVRVECNLMDQFHTIVGVLQGCVLSLLLFCIFLEIVMARTTKSEE